MQKYRNRGACLHFRKMILFPESGYLFYSHDTTIFKKTKQNQVKSQLSHLFINKKSTSTPCSVTSYKISKNHTFKPSNFFKNQFQNTKIINISLHFSKQIKLPTKVPLLQSHHLIHYIIQNIYKNK